MIIIIKVMSNVNQLSKILSQLWIKTGYGYYIPFLRLSSGISKRRHEKRMKKDEKKAKDKKPFRMLIVKLFNLIVGKRETLACG